MEPLPYLERVKIQSEILLPLYRRLRDELGKDKANALLRAAVKEYAEDLGHSVGERWQRQFSRQARHADARVHCWQCARSRTYRR